MSIKTEKVSIDDLLKKVSTYDNNEEDQVLIRNAYEYAYKKHFSQKRITGDDYITHPLNVAWILTDIKADGVAISAALLHDTIEDSDSTYDEIKELFGEDVARIVEGVTKINQLNFNSETEQMAANQRKILVGLSSDVRVLIVKLADRLHNMRTMYVLSEAKQKRKSKETLEILTPIAHRLGMYKIKSELEDLSLRYSNPTAYFDIVEKLNLKKTERDAAVGEMMREVSAILNEHNITHEIKGRSKSIYSIYNKMSKGRKFEDIYDILALRIFVNTEQECYLALGLIHSKYKPVPKRFKDYIAMPKTNMYQSLHTTVFGIDGQLFEIQIRTYEMDKIAEYGIASHWSYKENKATNPKDKMEYKLEIFRSIIETDEDSTTPEEFINNVKKDILFNDSIYVYTPKGDVIELPVGSTCVDFAYRVHSEVGNKMVGAIVNDRIVPFDYVLKSGDIIKVNTSKLSKGPNKDWLNFAITSHAKNKIRAFYSKREQEQNLVHGERIFENSLRRKKLSINEVIDKYLDEILSTYNLKDLDDLYISLGSGKFTMSSILKIINKKENLKSEDKSKKSNELQKQTIKNDILVEGMNEIKVSLSGCCKPIPGDNIIGYITKGSGITVHRSSCKNIIDLDERLINVKWNIDINKKFATDILVYVKGLEDYLLDIITKASLNNISIESINTLTKGDTKIYYLTVMVENVDKLNHFIKELQNQKYVTNIERQIN